MNVNAISSTNFTSRQNYNRNSDKVVDNNDGTVTVSTTVSKTRFEKARIAAARGITAAGIAAIMLSGSGCSKSDDIDPSPIAPVDTINTKNATASQADLFEIAKILNVPIVTNSSNPKVIESVSLDSYSNDNKKMQHGTFTYDEDASTKDKSVYLVSNDKVGYTRQTFVHTNEGLKVTIEETADGKDPNPNSEWVKASTGLLVTNINAKTIKMYEYDNNSKSDDLVCTYTPDTSSSVNVASNTDETSKYENISVTAK